MSQHAVFRSVRPAAVVIAAAAIAAVLAASGRAATGASYAALGDSYSSGVGTGSYTRQRL